MFYTSNCGCVQCTKRKGVSQLRRKRHNELNRWALIEQAIAVEAEKLAEVESRFADTMKLSTFVENLWKSRARERKR